MLTLDFRDLPEIVFYLLIFYSMNDLELSRAVERFLEHGQICRNYQPATVANYRGALRLFQSQAEIALLSEVSKTNVEQFLYDGRVTRHWSVCTFRTYHKQLRAFFNWCVKTNLMTSNPTDNIEKPPLEKKLPRALSREDASRLLEAAYFARYHYKNEAIRNRAVIGIMLLAGLRLSEVHTLKSFQIDLIEDAIFIADGKWGKDRYVPINARLKHFLLEYQAAKSDAQNQIPQFFTNIQTAAPLGERGVQLICRKLRDETGIYFSPQVLRHTFATLAYEGSRDIYAVSGLLGHAKVETTQIYAHLSMASKRVGVDQHLLNTI